MAGIENKILKLAGQILVATSDLNKPPTHQISTRKSRQTNQF
jgi:hypothetical protein